MSDTQKKSTGGLPPNVAEHPSGVDREPGDARLPFNRLRRLMHAELGVPYDPATVLRMRHFKDQYVVVLIPCGKSPGDEESAARAMAARGFSTDDPYAAHPGYKVLVDPRKDPDLAFELRLPPNMLLAGVPIEGYKKWYARHKESVAAHRRQTSVGEDTKTTSTPGTMTMVFDRDNTPEAGDEHK